MGLLGHHGMDAPDHSNGDADLGDLYFKHPVTLEARSEGLSWEQIVPMSLYFDGVQYTNNENFLGFYCTNLRTKKQRLVWLLSSPNDLACFCDCFALFLCPPKFTLNPYPKEI